jgi:hypothetical protein
MICRTRPSLLPASPGPADNATHGAVVSLRCFTTTNTAENSQADWREVCYRLTSRVKPITAESALLDLGNCTTIEALSALQPLFAHLAQPGIKARAGIGPTPVVAQLASRMMSSADEQQQSVVSTSDTPAFLKQMPIECLLTLAPPDAITVEARERLRCSGVRTLGQLARLDELTLRRQFGRMGAHLAALAQGKSLYPFSPTPPLPILRFCLRVVDSLTAEDALRQLPRLAMGIAKTLHEQGYEAGCIEAVIHWASGRRTRVERALRWRVCAPRMLARELARLVVPSLKQSGGEQIDEIRCALSDLQPPTPSQVLLWPQGRSALNDRRAQLGAMADTLAQRCRRPVLLISPRFRDHAIFSEDGYVLTPLGDAQAPTTRRVSREQRAIGRRQDRWQDPPLRLHWW